MFEIRNILFFDPFYFKNGNTAKAKYFIVLKIIENKAILASLPTSKDHIPYFVELKDGCVDLPDININCFVITPEMQVTECGKHFQQNTFLYGQHIDDFEIALMKELYPLENTDFIIWGKMKKQLYIQMIRCFLNSKSIKRKYKAILTL
jgi:hypothetical protein